MKIILKLINIILNIYLNINSIILVANLSLFFIAQHNIH